MNSFWLDSIENSTNFNKLEKDISTDVCIVGAGIFGLTCGYYLTKQGYNVVILEKEPDIASKTTGHTTAKITSQHNLIYKYLIDSLGVSMAQKYLYANQDAIENIAKIIEEEKIDCDFKRQDSYVYTNNLDELEKISIMTSHPLWMVKMFNKQYGLEKTKMICEEDNMPPTRSGRVNTLKTTKDELLKESCFEEGTLSQDALLYKRGNLAYTSYYKEGKVTIQDESSQLVARLLDPQKTDYVLDMCSAPGSKTTHLAALMENQGKIEAYDLYKHKVKLIEHNLKRLGVKNVHVQAGDSTKLIERYPPETFDRILLDAPCSGFGVLKRKPEIKYHDSSVMDGLIPLQALLLENAYNLLKNDGTMVYSTCTINKKENGMMIEHFIQKHPDMKVIEQRTILNYEYHTDGFYMCKMKKG